MNLCISKCSHKAQILEHDESLTEDVCFSPLTAQGAQTPSVGTVQEPQHVGRLNPALPPVSAGLQMDSITVPSVLANSRLWQATPGPCASTLFLDSLGSVLALPKLVSPQDAFAGPDGELSYCG